MEINREILQIIWTDEYDEFKLYDKNREIDTKYADTKIRKSLEKEGWLKAFPMIVNEEYEIMDGQHRFIIAKELGIKIPVMFVNNFTDKEMIAINNASKKWSDKDFLAYKVKKGEKNAEKLLQLCEKYNLSVRIALRIANVGDYRAPMVDLIIRDFDFEKAEKTAQEMWEILNIVKEKTTRAMSGLLYLIKHPDYDHKKMIEKLNRQLDRFHHCNSLKAYIEIFENIYNYQSKNKLIVRK